MSSSELESALAGRVGQRLHAAMEPETRAVERDRLDAERLRLLGDALPDDRRGVLVAAVREVLAQVGLERRGAREHLVAGRRDDLRVDVLVRAVDDESRRALLADADPRFPRAAHAGFLLAFAHIAPRPYFFLVSLSVMRSS